jgi:transcriptional regulator with XRE-family HTH domain
LVRAVSEFSDELRRLLGERGISTRECARQVPCDGGYVSKLASGIKRPSPEMAERLDQVLAADGTLAALAPSCAGGGTSGMPDDPTPLPALLPLSFRCGQGDQPRLTVDGAEAVLSRLYRIDAEMGGNDLCAVVVGYLRDAAQMFGQTSGLANADRMHQVIGGLTQIAGWLSIDASKHGDARRYLAAAIYAAHEAGDLGLAGHALGYLSLSALYRNNHREALSLAEAAVDLTRGATPATQAVVRTRNARALARDGSRDECRRQLDLAEAAFAARTEPEPQWCRYVDRIELAAQRGACFLDLKMPVAAVAALTDAIAFIASVAPGRVRDLAHYSIRLALAHLAAGSPEQAVDVAGRAYVLAGQVASARVSERFSELVAALEDSPAPLAREFAMSVQG